MEIKDLTVNDQVTGMPVLLSSVSEGTTKGGTPFVKVTVSDKTGDISGNIWGTSKESFEYDQGTVVSVTTKIKEWNGLLQLDKPTFEKIEGSLADVNLYLPEKNRSQSQMKEYIWEMVDEEIHPVSEYYANLITELLKSVELNGNNFWSQAAAAKMHQAYPGGLAEHAVQMLKHAEGMVNSGALNSEVNKALLYTSIILHDIGKVSELSGPVAGQYTKNGTLQGHTLLAIRWIDKTTILEHPEKYNTDEHINLIHSIASHHGKEEWGAIVKPATKEAVILHQIDMIDSRIAMVDETLATVDQGELSDPVFGLDGARLYNG